MWFIPSASSSSNFSSEHSLKVTVSDQGQIAGSWWSPWHYSSLVYVLICNNHSSHCLTHVVTPKHDWLSHEASRRRLRLVVADQKSPSFLSVCTVDWHTRSYLLYFHRHHEHATVNVVKIRTVEFQSLYVSSGQSGRASGIWIFKFRNDHTL